MEQRQKYNKSSIETASVARLDSPIVFEVLSLWLPAIIVCLLILGAFPF
jgi:hypothetical protein